MRGLIKFHSCILAIRSSSTFWESVIKLFILRAGVFKRTKQKHGGQPPVIHSHILLFDNLKGVMLD